MTLARLCGDAALTPWYPPTIKPVRKGWYQRDYPDEPLSYCYWDSELWSIASNNPHMMGPLMSASGYQSLRWRGLKRRAK